MAVNDKKLRSAVRKALSSLYMQGVMRRKGWSAEIASAKVVEWLHSRSRQSLHDFMEAA